MRRWTHNAFYMCSEALPNTQWSDKRMTRNRRDSHIQRWNVWSTCQKNVKVNINRNRSASAHCTVPLTYTFINVLLCISCSLWGAINRLWPAVNSSMVCAVMRYIRHQILINDTLIPNRISFVLLRLSNIMTDILDRNCQKYSTNVLKLSDAIDKKNDTHTHSGLT